MLLRFLVRLVLAAALAKLLHLETTRSGLLVLRRRVVALLALGALHGNNFPHFRFASVSSEKVNERINYSPFHSFTSLLSLDNFRDRTRAHGPAAFMIREAQAFP